MGNLFVQSSVEMIAEEEVPAGYGRDYGEGRVPLSLKKAQISPELLIYLRSNCDIFNASEKQISLNSSFEKCIDYPTLPNHRYYEGYFHGEKTSLSVKTMNPRYGNIINKKAAPLPLRALCECVRRKLNSKIINALQNNNNQLSQYIKTYIEKGYAFSDLAIQIHSGDEVNEEHLGWHTDAPNSLLHMALTIGDGVRALHSKRCMTSTSPPDAVVQWQQPGNVYISSPACFEHAVQYKRALLWSNRIIAIQARFPQYDDTLLKTAMEANGHHFLEFMENLKLALSDDFEMPSLLDVQEVEVELKAIEVEEAQKTASIEAQKTVSASVIGKMWKKKNGNK
jgi:hypothetical protein